MTPTPPFAITPDQQDLAATPRDYRFHPSTVEWCCATDVRAYAGWNAKGVVLSGNDADAHWANPPRPFEE